MKLAVAAVLATVLLVGSGCSTPRQQPIPLSAQALQAGSGRIGVAMTALPKVDVHLPGTGCTACTIAATAANAQLLLHAATLPADSVPTPAQPRAEAASAGDCDGPRLPPRTPVAGGPGPAAP